MDRDELIRRVSELNLPLGQYCVVGSGPLVVRNLRDGDDIDVLVTESLFAEFFDHPAWEEEVHLEGKHMLKNPPFQIMREFGFGEYWPEPETLIDQADVVEGVAFAPLEEIVMFKQALGRSKDQRDIALINEYLYEHADSEEELL